MTTLFPKPLDKSVSQTQDGLAIVANGNTHAAISSGQFVYVKNHDTLAEGLYKATSAIAQDGALSTSNLTPDGTGGLNDLQSQVTALNSNIAALNSKYTVRTYTDTLKQNSNVPPFTALLSLLISDDVTNYGDVVSVVIIGGGSAAKPMTIKLSSTQKTCHIYGMEADASVTVRITYMRVS